MADTAHVPDGYVLVDKPVGPSSHDAVRVVRRALGARGRRGTRAGHAGTLDPFASGLLVVLVGGATRLMPRVVGHDKRYLVDVRFGAGSDTDDATGTLTPDDRRPPSSAVVADAVVELAAQAEQVPPAVSAIHIDGVRAYQRVRRGELVRVPARPVVWHSIEVVDWAGADDAHTGPRVVLDVSCGSGAYMRALARDLGELVGCAAHCEALRRTHVGSWCVAGAPAPDAVSVADVAPAEGLVPELPRISIDVASVEAVRGGRRLDASAVGDDGGADGSTLVLLGPDGGFVSLAERLPGGRLQPRTVFAPARIDA